MTELYAVRAEVEGLAARLAARDARTEEVQLLNELVIEDRDLVADPAALSWANRQFHKQVHLASLNRYLVQQLDLVHCSMALLTTTSRAIKGRSETALDEHQQIVEAIAMSDEERAFDALQDHISAMFVIRLKLDGSLPAKI